MNAETRTQPKSFFARMLTTRQYLTARKTSWIVVAALVVAAVGLSAATAIPDGNAASKDNADQVHSEPIPVEVIRAERVLTFDRLRRYTGTVAARRTSDVGFERSARLVEVAIDEGDLVRAGQRLANLDTRHLDTRRDELTAQRAEAAAILEELETGPRDQTIAAARAELVDLDAQVEQQTRTQRRTQKLFERNAAVQQKLDDDQFLLESVTARRNAARERLSELEEGTRKERIAAQRAAVARLDALLADVAIEIEDSTLAAPFDGRIAERYVDEGTVVNPGQPIVRLVESAALEARIGLPVETASRFATGDAVQIVVNRRVWDATVDEALPEVDLSTRTRLMVFRIDPAASQSVVPGEIARIEVNEDEKTDGFWLPTASLTPGTRGLWSVYAVVGEQVERRDVEILHTAADRTLIRGTLSDGDQIVAHGAQRIVPGQRVKTEHRQL